MLWLKAFHIVFVVTWFAGLFYLPRLFVYHASATDSAEPRALRGHGASAVRDDDASARRWRRCFGHGHADHRAPALLGMGWLHAKLALVAALIGYHIWCYRLMVAFAATTTAIRTAGIAGSTRRRPAADRDRDAGGREAVLRAVTSTAATPAQRRHRCRALAAPATRLRRFFSCADHSGKRGRIVRERPAAPAHPGRARRRRA